MGGCCDIDAKQQTTGSILWIVLFLNLGMFIVQVSASFIAHSNALLADASDMLGDVLTYGISLYALNRDMRWKIRASLFKGGLITLLAIAILIKATIGFMNTNTVPNATLMIIFSLIAMLVNGSCFLLLWKFRNQEINMKSSWICARNDLLVNISVLVSGLLVLTYSHRWPDLVISIGIAIYLLYSAVGIIKESLNQGVIANLPNSTPPHTLKK